MALMKRPRFAKGRIVKQESLELLRDLPAAWQHLYYESYSDGVLYGFSIALSKEQLFVSAGAIKQQGQIVFLPDTTLLFSQYDQLLYIKVRIAEEKESEDFWEVPFELVLEETPVHEGEWELGRFRLSKGAALRTTYENLRDYRTSYNTLDITHVYYAGRGHPTLPPVLLRQYARERLEKGTAGDWDSFFCLQCLQEERMMFSSLSWYIAKKRSCPVSQVRLEQCYEWLVQWLYQAGEQAVDTRGYSQGGPRIL